MKVICTDDKNRPSCVPEKDWLCKDTLYTCGRIHPKNFGYILQEININNYCPTLTSFHPRRFRLATEDEVKADTGVKSLLKELKIKVI